MAAVALIVAVHLQLFTPVRMNATFAVFFVIVATMAAAGVWAVVRFALDSLFGTGFLFRPGVDEHVIERNVMLEFVYSTVAGVGAGLVFDRYFRRQRARDARLPRQVAAELRSEQSSFDRSETERSGAPLAEGDQPGGDRP